MQDFVIVLVELHNVPVGSFLNKKLSLTPSRNLHGLLPTTLHFQQVSARLNYRLRMRVCDSETSSSCLKKASTTFSPWSFAVKQTPTIMSPLVALSSGPDSQALNQTVTCLTEALHLSELLHIDDRPPCLSWLSFAINLCWSLQQFSLVSIPPRPSRSNGTAVLWPHMEL